MAANGTVETMYLFSRKIHDYIDKYNIHVRPQISISSITHREVVRQAIRNEKLKNRRKKKTEHLHVAGRTGRKLPSSGYNYRLVNMCLGATERYGHFFTSPHTPITPPPLPTLCLFPAVSIPHPAPLPFPPSQVPHRHSTPGPHTQTPHSPPGTPPSTPS